MHWASDAQSGSAMQVFIALAQLVKRHVWQASTVCESLHTGQWSATQPPSRNDSEMALGYIVKQP
jgi:hypothetical protein